MDSRYGLCVRGGLCRAAVRALLLVAVLCVTPVLAADGKTLYGQHCGVCHSVGGENDIMPLTAHYPLIGMDAKISGFGRLSAAMPPFSGTVEERMLVAAYIVNELHGGAVENIPVKPAELTLEIPPFNPDKDEYVLLAWNNLGMHCISDSYSEWVLLPPANDIWAQLIRRGERPSVVTQGVILSYSVEAGFEKPAERSTFWQYAESLFGVRPPDNVGLSGNGMQGVMKLHADLKSFEAALIPVEPYPAQGGYNPYPVFTVQARDAATGRLLAETKTVAPTSTEMGCRNCHGGPWKHESIAGISQETGRNVLKAHDRLSGSELAALADKGKPQLCQSCHPDPVLNAKGDPALLNLPAAIHGFHANYLTGRGSEACAYCHPNNPQGPTRCLRGVHATAGIGCVKCHGYMEDHAISLLKKEQEAGKAGAARLMEHYGPRMVAGTADVAARTPWLQEPDCATCHKDYRNRPVAEQANAFNVWTAGGAELYRNRPDAMGAVMCIACHNSPHASYPAVNAYGRDRDNIGPMQYQNAPGPVGAGGNCAVCHTRMMQTDAHHMGRTDG
ncbi:c-type cytochrome [Oleidesulfovibrio alaskensis]|jgi:mono/diheme cytochrome c family protein|uniref:c-type cytochrome n=1 Tax=Oleidesulfovibrio alaskensis TaxID=58180 RepID=UPI00041FEEC8|nr:cytochrome c3 family protein [Oleidesulfovibrio alaskensis]MBL3583134.1 cytochrome c [Oleidesulfovibrio alaskensis]